MPNGKPPQMIKLTPDQAAYLVELRAAVAPKPTLTQVQTDFCTRFRFRPSLEQISALLRAAGDITRSRKRKSPRDGGFIEGSTRLIPVSQHNTDERTLDQFLAAARPILNKTSKRARS